MENSYLLGKAVWLDGSVVLMVFGGTLIALALYYSGASTREIFSRCIICEELKNRVTHSRIAKVLARKDYDAERKED